MGKDNVTVLDSGATANFVRFMLLGNCNLPMARRGLPWIWTYPASGQLKFGDGRLGGVRFVSNFTVGIAGRAGNPHGVRVGGGFSGVFARRGIESPRGPIGFLLRCVDSSGTRDGNSPEGK